MSELEKDDLKRELIRFIVDELMDGEDDFGIATVENLLLTGVIDSLGILRLVSHIGRVRYAGEYSRIVIDAQAIAARQATGTVFELVVGIRVGKIRR